MVLVALAVVVENHHLLARPKYAFAPLLIDGEDDHVAQKFTEKDKAKTSVVKKHSVLPSDTENTTSSISKMDVQNSKQHSTTQRSSLLDEKTSCSKV